MVPGKVLGRLERIDETRKVRESSVAPIAGVAISARPGISRRLLLARRERAAD
jgi:hypothetical protein